MRLPTRKIIGIRLAPALLFALALGAPSSSSAWDSTGAESSIGVRTDNIPQASMPYPFAATCLANGQMTSDPFFSYASSNQYTGTGCAASGGVCGGYPGNLGMKYRGHVAHDRLGRAMSTTTNGNDPNDWAVKGLMRCERGALTNGKIDLTKCKGYEANDREPFPDYLGWALARRSLAIRAPYDTPEGQALAAPEHMAILEQSAKIAGFDTIPLLKERYWLRYPSEDAFVASPLARDGDDATMAARMAADPSSVDLIVGQSWRPTGFANGRALVTRGFQPTALSQIPDISTTIWDWAGGNQECAAEIVSGMTGPDAYGNANAVYAYGDKRFVEVDCHQYSHVLGASLNSSHFMPSAKMWWEYYHRMALARMNECKAIATALPESYFYHWVSHDPDWFANHLSTTINPSSNIPRYFAPRTSEAHECEREAMVYEAMGQHFLQDAWSSGHMWRRWGYGDLGQFPYAQNSELVGGALPLIPQENIPARRMLTSMVLGGFSGSIHGAGGVLEGLLAKKQIYNTYFAQDPLCGPTFFDANAATGPTGQVGWLWEGDDWVHSGVGDLFWDPYPKDIHGFPLDPALVFSLKSTQDASYLAQRNWMLECGAASLKEVYEAGPKLEGDLGAWSGSVPPVSVSNTKCWGHWITNRSMGGSLGAGFLTRQTQDQLVAKLVSKLQPNSNTSATVLAWLQIMLGSRSPTSPPDSILQMLFDKALSPEVLNGFLPALTNKMLLFELGGFQLGGFQFGGDSGNLKWGDSPDAKHDRDKFRDNLSDQLALDTAKLKLNFTATAVSDYNAGKSGTQSANAVDLSGNVLTVLGVSPNGYGVPNLGKARLDATDVYPQSQRPTSYADEPAPNAGPDDFSVGQESPTPHRNYIKRVFWRSHLKEEVCEHPELPALLRDRCVGAAAYGGDPEACTMCVDVVEAFLPVFPDPVIWQTENRYEVGMSKCDALAGNPKPPMPPDLAATVDYNWQQPRGTLANSGNFPPYIVAMGYCLGTTHAEAANDPDIEDDVMNHDPWNWKAALRRSVGPTLAGGTDLGSFFSCGYLDGPVEIQDHFMSDYFSEERQVAVYQETPGDLATPYFPWSVVERVPAPGPMVNVVDVQAHNHRFVVNAFEPCGSVITLEPKASVASSGNLGWTDAADQFWKISKWSDSASRFPTRVSDDGPIMFCGTLQRQLLSTVSCAETKGAMPIGDDTISNWTGAVDVHNGSQAQECMRADPVQPGVSLARCSVQGPVEFVPTCPIGTCSASGVCVGARVGATPLGLAPTVAVIPQGIRWTP